ncbi:MAG TPA: UDP-glucose 4-epimerase GalE [Brevundimonas sp.]|jgi:UDP-glucose 4-epimerase/UDP-arabinose 4-epimerase
MLRHVLVTGGAGYIGSHTCKALAQAGHQPVVFDDLSNGHAEAVKWGPLVVGDVRDSAAVASCMREHRIDSVIHFAGLIEVGRSMVEPELFWDQNLNGVAAVLGAMRTCGVDRIVFSSTAAVYGTPPDTAPLNEAAPKQPINPYGDSKLAAERLIAAACRAHGLEGIALRYFNAAGADPDGEIGEAHHPESHLIPLAIEAALGIGQPLTLFGSDFPTPDGTCVRDYIHVCDLAAAHVLALDAPAGPDGFSALNLGNGVGYSVRQVVDAVAATTQCMPPHAIGPRREGDPALLVADPSAARRQLGWSPRFDSLEDIVASAVAWRLKPRFGKRFDISADLVAA